MSSNATSDAADRLVERVDHLVFSTTDLEKSVADLERCVGVRASPGGQHPGRGTHNALIALSNSSYLEIVGPDPAQPTTGAPRWFGVDTLATPRLFTWAVKGTALTHLAEKAARRGVGLGTVVSGSRKRSDGVILKWHFTDPATVVGDGLVPFFIDWGDSPHPAVAAPSGPALISLRGQHPEPVVIRRYLASVGISLPIEHGPRPTLIATLKTATGIVEIW